MVIIGVDCGATGAIAVLNPDGTLAQVIDMPTVEEKVGRTVRNRVNPALVVSALAQTDCRPHIFVEKVNGMPRDGGGAAFTFGTAYGVLLGVLAALNLRHTLVTPAVWKKAVGCPADKGGARARAMQLFPAHADLFRRVKDADRAEASLLAFYGWQTMQRQAAL